ncbi:dienelactone hydrolase family protein [Nocardia arthritidis]|uniref:dienelactone hydrolase family protein n=1 Tax=Nocardia arthritidis TaxID=228602 RepID=UPI00147209E7|nr:dienelactone hydrolase family protein [Nocardia arthritidis]
MITHRLGQPITRLVRTRPIDTLCRVLAPAEVLPPGDRVGFGTRAASDWERIDSAQIHGGDLAGTEPDSPHLRADRVAAGLYFGHADQDRALPPEQVDRLEKALTDAGARHRCEVYPGAHHGFTQADTAA